MQNTITKNFTETKNKQSFLHSNDNKNLFIYIEKRLNQIFFNEMNSDNSIFRKVKSSAIQKMALFLSNNITRSCSVGIAGETASGKSTIALDIINTIQGFAEEYCIKNAITRINTDDYYYDRSDMVKKAGSFAEFAKHYDLDVPLSHSRALSRQAQLSERRLQAPSLHPSPCCFQGAWKARHCK